MRNTIIKITALFFTAFIYGQKILPVEEYKAFKDSGRSKIDEGITQIKDINHKLDKFVGLWVGKKTVKGIDYDFHVKIEKVVDSYDWFTRDNLILNYKIFNSSEVIMDTFIPENSKYRSKGTSFERDDHYQFEFYGKNWYCNGQKGHFYLFYRGNKMFFTSSLTSYMFSDPGDCTDEGSDIFVDSRYSLTLNKIPDSASLFISNSFSKDKEGWVNNGNVTTELKLGGLNVNGVNRAYEGIKRPLEGLIIEPGKKLNISLDFKKKTTNAVIRLYIEELDTNGNHLSNYMVEEDLQTGTHYYDYTVKSGNKAILHIDKANTHLGEVTEFFVDTIVVSQ